MLRLVFTRNLWRKKDIILLPMNTTKKLTEGFGTSFLINLMREEKSKEATNPLQTVASANRTTRSGRKTVRLTPSQVAIAKKLGVPLEEYAKYVKE
jgi:hypothetical protein